MLRVLEHVFQAERAGAFQTIGQALPRIDARSQVTGETRYYADRTFPGLLHAAIARSECDHALIRDLDLGAAEAMPGVARILTHKDVPNNWYTVLK
ncbi:MAG: hypothetical protein ACREFV_10590, partial [Acetobacteraceae bacterium]